MKSKGNKNAQQYDEYWKLTVEYSDIHGDLFSDVLEKIVCFIDHNQLQNRECTSELNKELQEIIYQINPKKDMGSVRKSINQFIKLGFIKPKYKGYHPLTKKFLQSKEKSERALLFTQIFYESGSFHSSYSNDSTQIKEINFLLKTLAYCGRLRKQDLIALMVTDILQYEKGYLLPEELESQYQYAVSINFEQNKYNQIRYLIAFLSYMPILTYSAGTLSFTDKQLEIENQNLNNIERDPVLYRIYRKKLYDESVNVYSKAVCYACKLPWKGLVASHIKPLAQCLKERKQLEAYDKDNGLLLSPNIDAYFDKFDITFDEQGKILIGQSVDKEIRKILNGFCLDHAIMTTGRKTYLNYHRAYYKKVQSSRNLD